LFGSPLKLTFSDKKIKKTRHGKVQVQ